MNNQLQETYDQVCKEYVVAEQRLNELRLQKETLERAGALPSALEYAARKARETATPKGKAKHGELTAAIMNIVKARASTNGDIRRELRRQGYPYSLEMTHFSKTLQRLARKGLIKGSGPKTSRVYVPGPKAK